VFCPGCGTRVSGDDRDQARHAQLASRAPNSLLDKMRAAPLGGERKPVTALFADVVGSTALAESLDPEDWAAIMNQTFEVMSEAIFRYEGTIAQLAGDGILAFFGAPVAHEDDPERALRAAIDLRSGLAALDKRLRDALGRPLEIRVGINTGLVIVGDMGSDFRYEYTAFGDAVNVAARMQTAADPGAIVITDDTYARVAPLVDVRDLGPVSVKGKSEPVHAYEVAGLKEVPGRRRGIPGLHSPMIGRDGELQRLAAALAAARAGQGRVAVVVGEPGIGKTRLIEEFRAAAGDDGVGWVVGRGLSYGQNLAYHVLLDLVRGLTDVPAQASPDVAAMALSSELHRLLRGDADDAFVYLAHLLDLPVQDERVEDRDLAALHRHYIDALATLLQARAEQAPVVLLAEDIHWADPSSIEALSQLLPTVTTARLLLVCTSRAERDVPGWEFLTEAQRRLGPALVEIDLAPLSPADSREVVGHLLEIESLPEVVREVILTKAEGNPFFVEEVIRMLIERGVIVRRDERWVAEAGIEHVEIPDTVRGLLLSRIDKLADDAKRTLHVASVLGRRFSPEILEEVRAASGDTAPGALLELESAGLVYLWTAPEVEYAFRHALVHETAYASLLRQERQRLHGLVGEVLARRAPDPPGAAAAVLARHFEEAGDVRRTVEYLLAAAEFALQRSAVREARAFYDRVLALLDGNDGDEQTRRWQGEAGLGRVVAGYTYVPFDEARADLEAALPIAEALGDERLLARTSLWLVRIRVEQGDAEDGEFAAAFERAQALAERLDDPRLQALLDAVVGAARLGAAEFREAVRYLVGAARLFEGQENFDAAAYNAALAAVAHARLGEFESAEELAAHAESLASGTDDPNLRLDVDLFRGMVKAERGDIEEAMALTERGLILAEEVGNTRCLAVGSFHLGDQQLHVGATADAIRALERGEELATFCSMGDYANLSRIWLEAARTRLGTGGGLAGFDAGVERARRRGDRFVEAHARRQRALACAASTDPDWSAVSTDFEASVDIFEALEARPALAKTLWEYGMILQTAGFAESDERLARASALFEELGMTPYSPAPSEP
jgi:predicted ATPase/class 3 adenylate cyclase